MTTLLFVTAEIPIERVNRFLSEHQSIRDLVENSIYTLIRDRNVSIDEFDREPGTEPPVDNFKSDFIGATDTEMWQAFTEFCHQDDIRPGAGMVERQMFLTLDKISATEDTVRVLYQAGDDDIYAFRVAFRFMPAVTADLTIAMQEEIYLRPEMRDQNGVLDMKRIKDTIGGVWRYS